MRSTKLNEVRLKRDVKLGAGDSSACVAIG